MKYLKKLLYLFPFMVLASLIFFLPRAIKVKEIECISQFGQCPPDLAEKLSAFEGQNLKAIRNKTNETLENEPDVLTYSTQLKFPDKYLVTLVFEKPKYAINNARGFALISKNGEVITLASESLLPQISSNNVYNLGDQVKDEDFFALSLIDGMFNLYGVKVGRIENGSLIVEIPQGLRVIFPLEGDRDLLIGSVRLLISSLNEGSQDFKIDGVREIDLRFKNPVLR